METTTIHKLPKETILHILEFLDGKSVQTATSVCKNWSDLIGSSTKAMAKLKLSWNRRNLPSKGDQLNWRHQNVEIRIGNYPIVGDDFFKDAMERIIETINFSSTKNLTIATREKCDIPQITKLLSKMPHLENLCLMLLTCANEFDESTISQVTLPKLNTLKIFHRDYHNFVLKFIKADQLLELDIQKYERIFSPDNITTNFIKNCLKLKKLSIDEKSLLEMIDAQQEFDFQLNYLLFYSSGHETAHAKFNKFLLYQSSSLTELVFQTVAPLTENNIESIFKIKGLLKLALFAKLSSNSESVFQKLKKIPSLKELSIFIYPPNENLFKIFLEKFPNIKKLSVQAPFPNAIKHISIRCPNLVQLFTDKVNDSPDPGKNFSHLRKLQVRWNSNELSSLINNCPSTESLDLMSISGRDITGNRLDPILQNPTLSHLILRVESHDPYDEGYFDVFVNKDFANANSKKLKTLQLNVHSIHDLVILELMLNTKWIPEKRDDVKIQVLKDFTKNFVKIEQMWNAIPSCDEFIPGSN